MAYSNETQPGGVTAGDWFAQTTNDASDPTAQWTGAQHQIAQAFLQQGIEPTAQLVGQWGNNIDDRYLSKILAQIQSLPRGSYTAPGPAQNAPTTAPAPSGGTNAPDYVNLSDPTQKAVWDAFQAKGIQPRDQGDFQYWVDHINQSGGMTGDNGNYWTSRMAQSQGGVGDYQERPEAGSSGAVSQDYLAPFTEQFSYQPFQAPTGLTEQNDPGFQARMKLGADALQNSAAARGTLLTGNTAEAMQNYAQNFASNEYQNVYGRALTDWQTNYQKALGEYQQRQATFYANQNNPFAKLLAQETLDSQNTNALNNLNFNYAQLGASNQNAFNNLGLGYASLFANTLGQGSQAYTNFLSQYGNAQAGGQAGAANAWGGAFGGAANNALMAYYLSQYGRNNGGGMYAA